MKPPAHHRNGRKNAPFAERMIQRLRTLREWSPRARARGRFLRRWIWSEKKRMFPFFDTDEAVVSLINFHGRRCIFRAVEEAGKPQTLRRYLGHVILHAAFPQNGIVPITILRRKIPLYGGKESRGKYWGMVSQYLNPGDMNHQLYQEWWYHRGGKDNSLLYGKDRAHWPEWLRKAVPPVVEKHEHYVERVAVALAKKILIETGIEVSVEPRNVESVKGVPVFLEAIRIHPRSMLRYLREHPEIHSRILTQLKPHVGRSNGKTVERVAEHILEMDGAS